VRTPNILLRRLAAWFTALIVVVGLGVAGAGPAGATASALSASSTHGAAGSTTVPPSTPSPPGIRHGVLGTSAGPPHEGIANACYFTIWAPITTDVLFGTVRIASGKAAFQGCLFQNKCRQTVKLQYQDSNGIWWTQPNGTTIDTGWKNCTDLIGKVYQAVYKCGPDYYTQWRTLIDVTLDDGEYWYDTAGAALFCT
jgi:hypothetical protein